MKKLLISLIIALPIICNAQEINYPGNVLPTDSALLFAPGLVNTGLYTRDFSMTPDGKEIWAVNYDFNYDNYNLEVRIYKFKVML